MLPFVAVLQTPPSLELPAFTAYVAGKPNGASISEEGKVVGWTSPETEIEWGGYISTPGTLHLGLKAKLPIGSSATYMLRGVKGTVTGADQPSVCELGTIRIDKPRWLKLFVRGVGKTGADFGDVVGLELSGEPLKGAKFNLKPRRNAASVHLSYPSGNDTEWFYNEVTGVEDPVATYYMACGFARGYFGMQVNAPKERRIIFSIWDSGKEAVDRSKVNAADQVQLLAKGPNVFAGGFGNEGTGGHSHLVYPWKTGTTQKFLVHAAPHGDRTIYTGYFWDGQKGRWMLIASFSAPKDGHKLSGLYSFVEDFDGDNGNLKRKALYGPAWIYTTARGWEPLTTARFSHDVTGGKDRFDYDFGIEHDRYFLQNGAFEGSSPERGAQVHLTQAWSDKPKIDFAALEKLAEPR